MPTDNGPKRDVSPAETPDTAGWAEKYLDAANDRNSPGRKYKLYRTTDADEDSGFNYPPEPSQAAGKK